MSRTELTTSNPLIRGTCRSIATGPRRLSAALLAVVVVSALGCGHAAAQTIITEIIDATGDGAGNGLNNPFGIAVDAAGNAYVAGGGSANAFKITPGGAITEIIDMTGDGAGNGLSATHGIAVDSGGNVFVTGQASANAFKITLAGVITEIIDATGDGAGNGLNNPFGIAVDAAGNAYVAGGGSANAFKITSAGVVTEIIDISGDGNGLIGPVGITVDATGNVYVTGFNTDNSFKITPAGVITQIFGSGNGLDGPRGIAVDAAGNAYVTGFNSQNAFKITPGGVITEIIDATGDGTGSGLGLPQGIAVDVAGNVYMAGQGSDNAFKITPGGVITEIIDATGDGASNVLDGPVDIAVDVAGNIYVTGRFSHNAFKITPDCNGNGIADACDLACGPAGGPCDVPGCGTSQDCNANGIPDECETDCNGNGIPDECDVAGADSGYFTDFEAGAGPEWSSSITDNSVPVPFTRFSGRFGNDAQTLTLAVLGGIGGVLTFDLCIIDSWDGDGCTGGGGPDFFNVSIDGAQLFHETFATFNCGAPCQSFPGAPDVGCANFGWTPQFPDAIFRSIAILFTTGGSTLQITFQGEGLQELADESWGIDNIRVELTPRSPDCNANGIPDGCEVAASAGCPTALCLSGCLPDCNENCIPDECELDTDNDGVIDVCDNCPLVFNPTQTDIDSDGVGDLCDNCPNIPNPGQKDINGDGIGDVCPCPERGDMNDDGMVNGNDIALFVERLLGG